MSPNPSLAEALCRTHNEHPPDAIPGASDPRNRVAACYECQRRAESLAPFIADRLREAERCVAAVRKVLFEDASLSHDDRLSKAAALLYAPQSAPEGSGGSQDPNGPERPGEQRTAAQGERSDHHTPTEEKS